MVDGWVGMSVDALDDRLGYVMTIVNNVISLQNGSAMTDTSGSQVELVRRHRGRNQQLVLDALRQADRPLGAYELLRRLRGAGVHAPLQVYRALDRLIAEGTVHKIESASAYALCKHAGCSGEGHAVFAICTQCGLAIETHDAAVTRLLAGLAHRLRFRVEATTVELSGLCEACAVPREDRAPLEVPRPGE